MAKLTLNDVQNLENSDSAKLTINNNNTLLETTVERVLFRDGTNPNHMTADLDMNSNRILNLPAPIDPTEPVRKKEADDFVGFKETMQLTAAVEAAEDSAAAALASENAARNWATQLEDIPVAGPPDQFSAMHWAIKAQEAVVNVTAQREYLTADKIWYVGLKAPHNVTAGVTYPPGDDATGDGTFAKPWHSVNHALHHILSRVDCNGFAPVIMMLPGTYDANPGNPSSSYFNGMTPPGFATWGPLPDTPVCDSNIYDYGGAIVELAEPVSGKQGTGGQPIRLTSLDSAHMKDTILVTHGVSPISVLQSGRLIIVGLSFQTIPDFEPRIYRCGPRPGETPVIHYPSTIYATQGGVIEVASVTNLGAAGNFFHADSGGTVVLTGPVHLRSGTSAPFPSFASLALASGGASFVGLLGGIDLQTSATQDSDGVDTAPYFAPVHFQAGLVTATRGGRVAFNGNLIQPPIEKQQANPGLYPTKQLATSSPKYNANLGGGIEGITALQAIPGGAPPPEGPGKIDPLTFAWGI